MQWLIDLVIEAIGIPPCYIDRGDPVAFDYTQADLTKDGAWHELDLSGVVPAGAQCVHLTVNIKTAAVNQFTKFRKAGNANIANATFVSTQVAFVQIPQDTFVALSTDRKIEYQTSPAVFLTLNIAIRGWIL